MRRRSRPLPVTTRASWCMAVPMPFWPRSRSWARSWSTATPLSARDPPFGTALSLRLRGGRPCRAPGPAQGSALPAETTEAFCDGHVAAFAFFGGVPRSILYDNTTLAVARILGNGTRQRTRVFSELQSHYLFDDRFGRPGKGNDKGKVEGLVGYARRNYLVPVPRAESFEVLNAGLAAQCRRRLNDRLRRHTETIGERLGRDRGALMPLPPSSYDACDRRP